MTKNKQWINVGKVKKGKKGNNYIELGITGNYKPVTVTLLVKDAEGNTLAELANPSLNCSNPRNRPGLTEEQREKIPEFVLADVSLAPAKD